MIKVVFYSPKGKEKEYECEELRIADKKYGSFGVLENHVPVISVIIEGYMSIKGKNICEYVSMLDAVFDFKNNEASIIAEELAYGDSLDEAMQNISEKIEKRRNENRERNVELALAENELKKQIKKIGASNIK